MQECEIITLYVDYVIPQMNQIIKVPATQLGNERIYCNGSKKTAWKNANSKHKNLTKASEYSITAIFIKWQ